MSDVKPVPLKCGNCRRPAPECVCCYVDGDGVKRSIRDHRALPDNPMTDHPKPIARYMAKVVAKFDEASADVSDTVSIVVLLTDHEAALAAEQIHRMAAERTIVSRDARIAELERERDELKHDMEQATDGRNSEAQANEALRTAIESLAGELVSRGRRSQRDSEGMVNDIGRTSLWQSGATSIAVAAELRALLEKTK